MFQSSSFAFLNVTWGGLNKYKSIKYKKIFVICIKIQCVIVAMINKFKVRILRHKFEVFKF